MADLARYLRRVRRLVSPPGRPAPGAVPADRTATVADELADVFAAIDAVGREAADIRRQGEAHAREVRQQSDEEAVRIVTDGRRRSDEVRAAAAARRREEIEAEIEAARADDAAEAARLRTTAQRNLPGLADRVADRILAPWTGSEM